jgi:arsenite/tail-anchored protein-transporting ATPase
MPRSKADTNETASSRSPARFHFVGGKGGVGKTTCSAAFAVVAAHAGSRVLVASTDPAPSLGDAFDIPLSSSPRRIPLRTGSLHAVEIDAALALRRWIEERRSSLETIALQGTWLDQEDVTNLLGLSLPGIDEVAALLELARLAGSGRFDVVIVDTAPTGHTLRMLAMPATLFAIARVFDRMWDKHRVMVEALRGSVRDEPEDALIEELASAARGLASMLRDRHTTRLSWVTLPEPMAMVETADALASLESHGMTVADLIVNRVTPPPVGSQGQRAACRHCDARRAFERRALRLLPATGARIRFLHGQTAEPRGLVALRRIAKELDAEGSLPRAAPVPRRRGHAWTASLPGHPAGVDLLVRPETRLLLIGGKGGVGKTTCAAAAALAAAARWPQRNVLLISTDPAHSLGDALGCSLSDEPSRVPGSRGRLTARELDATLVFGAVKQKYANAIEQMFERLAGRSVDVGHDRSVMHGLIDLAPPGLDELAAIIEITDAISGEHPVWDLVVVDTAPTGHALRLLEMPVLIHDWTRALMSILLKYQSVTGLGDLGTLLLNLSRGIGRLRDLLRDRSVTRFIVVTRAAVLPREESVRLVKRLTRLKIDVPVILVNAVGRGTCARCRASAGRETVEIAAARRTLIPASGRRTLGMAAASIPVPHGPASLLRWQRTAWVQ